MQSDAASATAVQQLGKIEQNKTCADCGVAGACTHVKAWSTTTPFTGCGWATWNIGAFICIKCAGVHRGLGAQISKVTEASHSISATTAKKADCNTIIIVGAVHVAGLVEPGSATGTTHHRHQQHLDNHIHPTAEHAKQRQRCCQPEV